MDTSGFMAATCLRFDDFHRAQFETLHGAEDYLFHPLLTASEIKQQ